jgi:hypothetical protein
MLGELEGNVEKPTIAHNTRTTAYRFTFADTLIPFPTHDGPLQVQGRARFRSVAFLPSD